MSNNGRPLAEMMMMVNEIYRCNDLTMIETIALNYIVFL